MQWAYSAQECLLIHSRRRSLGATLRTPYNFSRSNPAHSAMYKLVLIRHGESTWNLENRFTGWTDVVLTPTGVEQA